MHKIQIRPAFKTDCRDLAVLVNSAYRGEISKKGWTTEADLLGGQRTDPQSLEEMLLEAQNLILIAHNEREFLGCVFLQKRAHCAYLGMLTVRPNLQSLGLGRAILLAAERQVFDTWDLPSLEMRVLHHRRELLDWYERRGYVRTDRREAFPYGDAKFGVPKVADLEFVVLEKRRNPPAEKASMFSTEPV